jgi:hypothetical protein
MADAARILKRRADRDKKKAEKYGVAITERIARQRKRRGQQGRHKKTMIWNVH